MTGINAVTDVAVKDGIGVITFNAPPVNSLTVEVREGLVRAMVRMTKDSSVDAIIMICDGRTFFVGADIASFDRPFEGPGMHEMEALIEDAPRPVIAAMHGTALGGGLELAMACHFRIAARSTKCGLPEVKLGIVPGGTGTQRLPRLVGVERALQMMTSGEHIPAQQAAAAGLIDAVVPDEDLCSSAIAFARQIVAERRPMRKVREMNEKVARARDQLRSFEDFRRANARKFRGFEAPEAVIQCVEAAVNLPFEQGVEFEQKVFQQLLNGQQSAAQRYLFFGERDAAKIPDMPRNTGTLAVKRVGIVGAGTMGGGIAMSFANAEIPVVIVEAGPQALDKGLSVIRRNYESSARHGRMTQDDVARRMGHLTGSLSMDDLRGCDLIIEAIYEDLDLKREVFRRLDNITPPQTILASNTSFLDINALAAQTHRPQAVLGLHFFSPANVMRLVEVVRGTETSREVLATAMALVRGIGKIAVVSGVCHGFIGNRMLEPRQHEAYELLLEGAMPWEIDRVLFDFGMPMGPFAMSDLAGLDIGWSREKSRGETICHVLCELDRRGQKTLAGFYDYDERRIPKPSPVTERIVREFATKSGRPRRVISDDEILQRCIYPMINEGAKILEEGIAARASDIDVVWVNGYGWPRYRGGPMFYADTIGLPAVRDRLLELADRIGPHFRPAGLLDRLALDGRRFRDL